MRWALFFGAVLGCGTQGTSQPDATSDGSVPDADEVEAAGMDADAPGMSILVSNQPGIVAMTVDTTNVYWTTSSLVRMCAIAGCDDKPIDLASGQNRPMGITSNGSTVVWSNATAIMSCPVQGGTPAVVASAVRPIGVVLDGTTLYWAEYGTGVGTGSIKKCDLNNCVPTTLATQQKYPVNVVVDTSTIFWNPNDGIKSCALGGCGNTPTTIVPENAAALVQSGNALYWPTLAGPKQANIRTCAKSGCASPSDLAQGFTNPFAIAADEKNIYWASRENAGSVMRCDRNGCGQMPTVIGTATQCAAIAVGATHVFWTDGAAIIKLSPK